MLPVNFKDQRFGLLTARKLLDVGEQGARWECDCDCGGTTAKTAKELLRNNGPSRHGHPLSCGCRQGGRERITLLITNNGDNLPMTHEKQRNPDGVSLKGCN
jgi:hypothetical protein